MRVKIIRKNFGGVEFGPEMRVLHLGGQSSANVERLKFELPQEWAGCAVTLHIQRQDGTLPAPILLDEAHSCAVGKEFTASSCGSWMLLALGEDGFRARETAQTARLAKEGRQLLSCGGGIIKRGENLRALHQNGVVLFIDRPLDALTVGGGRPLSSSPEALRQMEAERRPLYLAAADAVIPNSGTVEDAVAAAMEALDEIFSH